jgi:hypothetical protein
VSRTSFFDPVHGTWLPSSAQRPAARSGGPPGDREESVSGGPAQSPRFPWWFSFFQPYTTRFLLKGFVLGSISHLLFHVLIFQGYFCQGFSLTGMDGFVKVVTPVKTGVQCFRNYLRSLDSGFRRNDDHQPLSTIYNFIRHGIMILFFVPLMLTPCTSGVLDGCLQIPLEGWDQP